MRPAIFSSVFISIILVVSANANATSWHKVVEPPSGKTISQGIPCGAGTGWQMCGYPKEPEKIEECKVVGEVGKETFFVKYLKGTPQNGRILYEFWWDGKKLTSDEQYKLHKQIVDGYQYYAPNGVSYSGSYRSLTNDFPHLNNKYKNTVEWQVFGRGSYMAACRKPI